MESFHKDSDIVNIICVSSYFDLALLWVTFWQYEPQLSFFVLMDQGDKISWAETTQYVHCTVSVLSWAVSYKQSRGASRNPRQLTVLVDNLRTHLKMHSGEKLNLIQTMQEHFSKPSSPNCPVSTVGAFLPPTRLDCVQSSNNNLMTSKHTVCPSQKRNLKERKTYHNTISMSPN